MPMNYPLSLMFKITTFSDDFTVKDASERLLMYVRKKRFKLQDEMNVFADEAQQQHLYQLKANKWMDFSATYGFTASNGAMVGQISRKGWASIFNAHYEVFDHNRAHSHTIREENAWVKVMDGIFGEIPIIGLFCGYLFNPAYLVKNVRGEVVLRLAKVPSLIGRRFRIEQKTQFSDAGEEERLLLALSTMVMMERSRG
jgi:uncharacterized protein YxjI